MKKTEKQKKLTQDYADFLIEHKQAKAQGDALGTFPSWNGNTRMTVRV